MGQGTSFLDPWQLDSVIDNIILDVYRLAFGEGWKGWISLVSICNLICRCFYILMMNIMSR